LKVEGYLNRHSNVLEYKLNKNYFDKQRHSVDHIPQENEQKKQISEILTHRNKSIEPHAHKFRSYIDQDDSPKGLPIGKKEKIFAEQIKSS